MSNFPASRVFCRRSRRRTTNVVVRTHPHPASTMTAPMRSRAAPKIVARLSRSCDAMSCVSVRHRIVFHRLRSPVAVFPHVSFDHQRRDTFRRRDWFFCRVLRARCDVAVARFDCPAIFTTPRRAARRTFGVDENSLRKARENRGFLEGRVCGVRDFSSPTSRRDGRSSRIAAGRFSQS